MRVRGLLRNKKLLLGVTGSVAAYKSVDLIRRLKEEEASVTVVMTDASKRFVTPLSLELASGGRVFSGLFDDPIAHIELAREADLMLVAPATANTIGKFSTGLANDLLSTCFLAFGGRVVVAPAMNWRMYQSPLFQRNLEGLKSMGVVEVPPGEGLLACGEEGKGRMASIPAIIDAAKSALAERDLEGVRIIVTAGPTREQIDPVRFISNRSSGKMGFALARAARIRGADVTLISGPVSLEPPVGVRALRVETALEMKEAVASELKGASAVIMAAAVADFRAERTSGGKLRKSSIKSLRLIENPDILAWLGSRKRRPMLVGFAAESGRNLKRAREKLLEKGADIMVFNDISDPESGFEVDTNRIVIIQKSGREESLPLLTKEEAAWAVLDRMKESGLKPRKR
jgi:phosphopantothenoylcysteine decarboxylase/phosphopantothenate--cysteine ligase